MPLDDERLGVQEKIALLTLGIADIPEFAALQITVEGAPVPVVVTNSLFSKRLATRGIDPLAVLRLPAEDVQAAAGAGEFHVGDATHVRETDDWLATIVLPLRTRFAGAPRSCRCGSIWTAPGISWNHIPSPRPASSPSSMRRPAGCSTRSGPISAVSRWRRRRWDC